MMPDERRTHSLVALISGERVPYDACAENRDAYQNNNWDYLGEGVIHSVNDVLQTGVKTMHFWRIP